jgi:hypothetical protein
MDEMIKYVQDSTTLRVNLIFNPLIKILFAVHLKHSSFLPSADVKPMLSDLIYTKCTD